MRFAKLVVGCLAVAVLASCHHRTVEFPVKPVDSWADGDEGAVLVVGRIALDPPLVKAEQITIAEESRNKALVYLGVELKRITQLGRRDPHGRAETPLNQTFFLATSAQSSYYLGSVVVLERGKNHFTRKATLPGGLLMDIRPKDRAVYIGTIHYFRDEFFEIVRVEIEDDYEKANKEYQKKFGGTTPLRKALLRIPAPDKNHDRPRKTLQPERRV
jgi:hypothetical protein